jgi:hypothetical protein
MGANAGNDKKDNTNLHALLIGIDYYFPNILDGGAYYPSLGGCVRDIDHVEEFLLTSVKIPSENIVKLTCSIDTNDSNKPLESQEKWPTYDNIVAAFNKITEHSGPGDQLYIQYSGHGGRIKTLIPNKKGADGFDETLVPTDIGKPGTRYLRDIEMANILRKMVQKGLIVTLVLDSCHSGGATRGNGGATVRGTNVVDLASRPQDSLVAPIEELQNTWDALHSHERIQPESTASSKEMTRGLPYAGSGWLPDPRGYVLLAACRPSESAYEYAFEKEEKNGALTYWLLKSLKQLNKGLTYKIIHDRIVANVHNQFPLQTPMLEGDADREIFGSDRIQSVYAVNVMGIDPSDNNRILLNAGQVHGIKKGTKFAVYPSGFTDFSNIKRRLAIVEIQQSGPTNSWAQVITDFKTGTIEQGSQAVLIDPVDIELKRQIRLVYQNDIKVPPAINKNQEVALEEIAKAIQAEKGFLELAGEKQDKSHFQVAVNEKGEYEIWDPAGVTIPNLNPPISVNDNSSANRVIQRLIHLTKYSNIQRIENSDPASPLSRNVIAEVFKAPAGFGSGDRPTHLDPVTITDGNTKIANVGQKLLLRIKNNTDKVLNFTVFDLQPDWGVSQIYPTILDGDFIPIDANREEYFPLDVGLPPNYTDGKDILKVFATVDQTSFRWLELPALDQPASSKQVTRGGEVQPSNPLEQLMAEMMKDMPSTRSLNPYQFPSKDWTSVQIEVNIQK